MKSIVIPAQITTVEDRIAGNLTLTQILLLMVPVFWIAVVYITFPPKLHFAVYKVILMAVVTIISVVLALRIKGKLILHWLVVILRYNVRPRYYVFNKNDAYLRVMDMPVVEKKQRKLFTFKRAKRKALQKHSPALALNEAFQLDQILNNPNYKVRFSTKKGGINVAVEQIK